VKDEFGNTVWINNKTLKKSKNPPGVKSFKVNRQMLKKEAEEEQNLQIAIVEHRRKRFIQMNTALMTHRAKDLKQTRVEIIKQAFPH
jgi:hypothetical protein